MPETLDEFFDRVWTDTNVVLVWPTKKACEQRRENHETWTWQKMQEYLAWLRRSQ